MPNPLLRKGLGIFLFHFTTPSLPQLSFAKPYRPWIRRPLIPLSPSARTRGWKTRWKFAVQPCTIRADTLKEAGVDEGPFGKAWMKWSLPRPKASTFAVQRRNEPVPAFPAVERRPRTRLTFYIFFPSPLAAPAGLLRPGGEFWIILLFFDRFRPSFGLRTAPAARALLPGDGPSAEGAPHRAARACPTGRRFSEVFVE